VTDSFPEFCKTCIHRGEGTGGAHCLPCEVRYNVVTKEPRPSEYVVDYKVTATPIKDSGERTVFASGAVRDMHEGKGDMVSVPWEAILRLSRHYENGAKKYERWNYRKAEGIPVSSYLDSAMRHLAKYMCGCDDEDHLSACAFNVLGAMLQEELHPEMNDLPMRKGKNRFCYFGDDKD